MEPIPCSFFHQVLTKSLLPLPDKWHGLSDVEMRYRKRYLDMIVTPGVIDTFKARSKTISTMRRMLEEQGGCLQGMRRWRGVRVGK